MKFTITRPSPYAKALVLVAGLCLILNCHKQRELGTEGAAVARLQPSNSNANQNAANDSADAPPDVSEPRSSSARPARRRRTTTQQARPSGDEHVYSAEVVAEKRVMLAAPISGAASRFYSYENASGSPADPEALITQASELIGGLGKRARLSPEVAALGSVPSLDVDPRPTYLRLAAESAQKAVELLKEQLVPTQPEAKEKYMTTLLRGLSVRAEALGLLATNIDRTQSSAAETAYREYLAAESDDTKRSSAEHDFAAMLHKLEELDKAKSAYEALLARDAKDTRALAALVSIHREIATAKKAKGDTAEAEANDQLAASYSDRLSELNPQPNARPKRYAVSDRTKAAEMPADAKSDAARPRSEALERKRRSRP